MLPISRILVPVDFSERSLGILPYARAVAAQYHAPLTLMHVVSPFFMVPPTGLSGEVWIPVPGSTVTDRAKQLEEWAPDQLEGIEVRRLVYEGDTVGQIVSFATSEKIDLVVISTHGYGVLRRFLIGSVAAKLLHDLECPVLTGVHLEDAARSEPVKITKVLCAVDLGPETTSALSYATRFARDFSAELEVVHVIPALDPSFDLEASAGWRSSVMDKVREELARSDGGCRSGGRRRAHRRRRSGGGDLHLRLVDGSERAGHRERSSRKVRPPAADGCLRDRPAITVPGSECLTQNVRLLTNLAAEV